MHCITPDGVCLINYSGHCDECYNCIAQELRHAGYEIHKKGEIEQVEEGSPVATHLRLGDQPGGEQGDGNQGGERGDKEGGLTQKELAKLRKHMELWPE